ncbi:MAG: hypothetical protein ACE3L7_07950 [Candidatus Pristimantibacillus sp.]
MFFRLNVKLLQEYTRQGLDTFETMRKGVQTKMEGDRPKPDNNRIWLLPDRCTSELNGFDQPL